MPAARPTEGAPLAQEVEISVIIPVLNGESVIGQCLECLMRHLYVQRRQPQHADDSTVPCMAVAIVSAQNYICSTIGDHYLPGPFSVCEANE